MPNKPDTTSAALYETVSLGRGREGIGRQRLMLTRKATEHTTKVEIFNPYGVIDATIVVDVADLKTAVKTL